MAMERCFAQVTKKGEVRTHGREGANSDNERRIPTPCGHIVIVVGSQPYDWKAANWLQYICSINRNMLRRDKSDLSP